MTSQTIVSTPRKTGRSATPLESEGSLARHPIFAALSAPESLGGALKFLDALAAGLQEAQKRSISDQIPGLIAGISDLRARTLRFGGARIKSPTVHDLQQPRWQTLHACLRYRSEAKTAVSLSHIDIVMAVAVVNAAASNSQVATALLEGLRMLYKVAAARPASEEWTAVSQALVVDPSKLRETAGKLRTHVARSFTAGVLELFAHPMPGHLHEFAANSDGMPLERVVAPDAEAEAGEEIPESEGLATREFLGDVDSEGQEGFKQGDSILDWKAQRAAFSSRNERLGLVSWSCLPAPLTQSITSKLHANRHTTEERGLSGAAVLGLLSLVTSTPAHVLLCARLDKPDDLHFAPDFSAWRWNLSRFLAGRKVGESIANRSVATIGRDRVIEIPLPRALTDALLEMRTAHPGSVWLSDLLDATPDTPGYVAILADVYQLLIHFQT